MKNMFSPFSPFFLHASVLSLSPLDTRTPDAHYWYGFGTAFIFRSIGNQSNQTGGSINEFEIAKML